jgi:hypothetical protein
VEHHDNPPCPPPCSACVLCPSRLPTRLRLQTACWPLRRPYSASTCFTTNGSLDAATGASWVALDLGGPFPIDAVSLASRSDCCGSRDSPFKDRNKDIQVGGVQCHVHHSTSGTI